METFLDTGKIFAVYQHLRVHKKFEKNDKESELQTGPFSQRIE